MAVRTAAVEVMRSGGISANMVSYSASICACETCGRSDVSAGLVLEVFKEGSEFGMLDFVGVLNVECLERLSSPGVDLLRCVMEQGSVQQLPCS